MLPVTHSTALATFVVRYESRNKHSPTHQYLIENEIFTVELSNILEEAISLKNVAGILSSLFMVRRITTVNYN